VDEKREVIPAIKVGRGKGELRKGDAIGGKGDLR